MCPECGSPLKMVPAGVSKRTGNPYKAFIGCTNRECKYTEKLNNPSKPLPTEIEVDMATRVESKIDAVNKNVLDVKDQVEKLNQYLRGIGV